MYGVRVEPWLGFESEAPDHSSGPVGTVGTVDEGVSLHHGGLYLGPVPREPSSAPYIGRDVLQAELPSPHWLAWAAWVLPPWTLLFPGRVERQVDDAFDPHALELAHGFDVGDERGAPVVAPRSSV